MTAAEDAARPTTAASIVTEEQRIRWATVPDRLEDVVDVLVVGGGLGGVAAAVAAARRGVAVALLESSHMLGGQATAAGVSAMDVTFAYDRSINTYGIWAEVLERTRAVYRNEFDDRPVNTARYRLDSFGPNVAVVERVLSELVEEAGVTCYRNVAMREAIRSKDHVTIYTDRGWLRAKVVIDATETGALLLGLKTEHRIGNTIWRNGRLDNPDLDAIEIQDITHTAVIRRYPDGELPTWARMDREPPEYQRFAPKVRRAYPDSPGHQKVGPNAFAGYRGVADPANPKRYTGLEWEEVSRTSLNYHNDTPVSAAYLHVPEVRDARDAEAIHRTLAIIYFLQQELGLPWGLADDEGFAEGPEKREFSSELSHWSEMLQHLPLMPYIRESRRALGRFTLTGKHIFRQIHHVPALWHVEAVAVGTYPPDLHGGRRQADLEKDLDESLDDKPKIWREGPFPIPLGCLVPLRGDRLVVAEKNLSASRIASGALRLHPTVIATGEAAGALASIAVRRDVPVAEVPSAAVQLSLVRGGALVAPARIDGVLRGDDRHDAIMMAVCRRLIDTAYSPGPVLAPNPAVTADLVRAEALGGAFIAAYADWDIDAHLSSSGSQRRG